MADTAIEPATAAYTYSTPAPLIVQSYDNSGGSELSSTTLVQLFPSQRVPIDAAGTMFWSNEWYRFQQYNTQYISTGAASFSLAELVAAVNEIRVNSTRLDNLTAALAAQNEQNAASLDAVVVVTQTAALPGASTIPPVQPYLEVGGGGD